MSSISQKSLSRAAFVKGAGAAIAALGTSGMAAVALAEQPADQPADQPAVGSMVPGLYVSTVPSIKGDMTVAVLVDADKIVDIKVTNHVDTPALADVAIADVSGRIVAQQNTEVDACAGAALSSFALRAAVEDCLAQAGADLAAFQKGGDRLATADKQEGAAEDWDVVVVGSGFAGMGAAITAKRAGVERVLVLEKEAMCGGSSCLIGGCISIMGGSAYNEEAGVDCTKEEFVEPLLNGALSHGNDDFKRALLGNVYDACGDLFTYYHDHGFPMNSADWYRDFNLGGKVPCFNAFGYSDHTYETGHLDLTGYLVAMAEELGAEVRTNARVVELLADDAAVTGVRVEGLDSVYEVSAKKVILATGGFQWNQDLMEQYNAGFAKIVPFAAGGCTGDAFALVEPLDVPIVGAGGAAGWPCVNSALGWYGPIADLARTPQVVLDALGNVLGSGAIDMDVLCATPDCIGYAFYDNTSQYRNLCFDGAEMGLFTTFDSMEQISEEWGIDLIGIETAFGTYGLSVPPFYGIKTHPSNIITFPGPQIDENCRVVNASGEVVENLYAAGVVAFGNMFEDVAEDPGIGGWVGTFSSSCICNCMGAVAAADAAAAIA